MSSIKCFNHDKSRYHYNPYHGVLSSRAEEDCVFPSPTATCSPRHFVHHASSWQRESFINTVAAGASDHKRFVASVQSPDAACTEEASFIAARCTADERPRAPHFENRVIKAYCDMLDDTAIPRMNARRQAYKGPTGELFIGCVPLQCQHHAMLMIIQHLFGVEPIELRRTISQNKPRASLHAVFTEADFLHVMGMLQQIRSDFVVTLTNEAVVEGVVGDGKHRPLNFEPAGKTATTASIAAFHP